MSMLTGSDIISIARVLSGDDDAASNYAVSDARAVTLLNDILVRFSHCFKSPTRYYGASATGLTVPAGTTTVLSGIQANDTFDISGVAAAYQTNSDNIATVLSSGLPSEMERLTVPDLIAKFDRDNQDESIPQTGENWLYWAAEPEGDATKDTTDTYKWRFWVYPAINRTQYITLRGVDRVRCTDKTHHISISATDAQYVARLLAYEMAVRQKEIEATFLAAILSPLPKQFKQMDYAGAVSSAQAQDGIEWTVD